MVALLVGAVMLLGVGMAWAITVAQLVQTVSTGNWNPPSAEPSGVAYIDSGDYLFVVDTNVNNPDSNGWEYDIQSHSVTNRATGVVEPSGIDYDPDTNTLFITQDNGHIFIFSNFDTPQEDVEIMMCTNGVSTPRTRPTTGRTDASTSSTVTRTNCSS